MNRNIPTINDVLADFDHPNPNINRCAFKNMKEFWPRESIVILIRNLDSRNIPLRRKSVKALGYFGISIVKDIIQLYFSSKDNILKVSCLKVLVIVASNYCLNDFKEEMKKVIDAGIKDQSVEIILSTISLLRQIGEESLPYLKALCRDKNVLKAKAAITAISEIPEMSVDPFLKSIISDSSLDILVREGAYQALNFKVN